MGDQRTDRFEVELAELKKQLPEHRKKAVERADDRDRQSMLNFDLQLPYTTIPTPLSRSWKSEKAE